MPKILEILWNPGSKIPVGFCRSSWGSNYFIKEIPCYITHYSMDNQAQYSGAMLKSTLDHYVLTELTFKDETPQGMEHVWI